MKGKSGVIVFLLLLFIQGYSSPLYSEDPMAAKQLLENLKKREFTGEVMDFDFDNIGLDEIFRRFELVSGFRFEVDTDLRAARKFSFLRVEWDRALHLILLNMQLELRLDDGVFRVIEARPPSNRIPIYFLGGILPEKRQNCTQ